MGSILAITDSSGKVVEQRHFGAWGEVDKFISDKSEIAFNHDTTLLNRGYTGHEHFMDVGLIHMNGRMYDAKLGRFISPDNFVQEPFNTQNFNRFGYVLNNPLKYVDPSGEIFKWLWKKIIKPVLKIAWNAVKITAGLFATGPGNIFERGWEILSRFTWQLPQTILGQVYAHAVNLTGNVDSVDYYDGATVIKTYGDDIPWFSGVNGVTLGSFIIGNNTIEADPNNSLFQHEYGHYLQSKKYGWAYLPRYGIPSARGDKDVEYDANSRAFSYFYKRTNGDFTWDFKRHTLNDGINWNTRGDNPKDFYNDPDFQLALTSSLVSPGWLDYLAFPFGGFIGIAGLINPVNK